MSAELSNKQEERSQIREMQRNTLYMSVQGWGIRFIGDQLKSVGTQSATHVESFPVQTELVYSPSQKAIIPMVPGGNYEDTIATGFSYGIRIDNAKPLTNILGIDLGEDTPALFTVPREVRGNFHEFKVFEIEGELPRRMRKPESIRNTILFVGPVHDTDYTFAHIIADKRAEFKDPSNSSAKTSEVVAVDESKQDEYSGVLFYQESEQQSPQLHGWPDDELWPDPKEKDPDYSI